MDWLESGELPEDLERLLKAYDPLGRYTGPDDESINNHLQRM